MPQKFKSKSGRIDVWVADKAVSVTVDGEYETSDKAEQKALSEHPDVVSVQTATPKKKSAAKKKG
jgi:hypothetical protein